MNRYKLYKAGVDVNGVLHRLGGDKELYEQLLQTFKNETHLEKLEAALTSQDAKAAFDAAHALKGECGNMGFSTLYTLISVLVDKLRVGDLSGTDAMFEEIRQAYTQLLEAIG